MRKVLEARLHQAYFAEGTGNLKPNLNVKEYIGMEIYKTSGVEGDGIKVHFRGVEFWIPAANIVGLKFAPEEKPTPIAAKAKAA